MSHEYRLQAIQESIEIHTSGLDREARLVLLKAAEIHIGERIAAAEENTD